MDDDELRELSRIVILSAGTSYHAAVAARYAIEEWARVPVEHDIASEWIYRNPVLDEDTLVIGISQSGETRDTIEAMKLARVDGRAHRRDHEHDGLADHARGRLRAVHARGARGQRRGVEDVHRAALLLFLVALKLAQVRETLPPGELEYILNAVYGLPAKIKHFLEGDHPIDEIARRFHDRPFFLYLGRNIGLPVALEGALKLKEISYIPTEAYSAGEMKHGPIALLDENTPVVVVATRMDRRLRQARLQHPGGTRPRRARDRDRLRRERGHPAPRRRRDLRAEGARVPLRGARGRPAAAPRVPHRPAPRPERRSAEEPCQDRDGRVVDDEREVDPFADGVLQPEELLGDAPPSSLTRARPVGSGSVTRARRPVPPAAPT